MKVRIKDNNGYVDADWTIEDGIMVVSPKVEKFEPKDGDVVFSGSSLISIFKEMTSDTSLAAYAALSKGELKEEFEFWSTSNIRPATEEEKQKLFDKLKEEGLAWDAEKKEIIKLKWKPVDHEKVYVAGFTFYGKHPFCPFEDKAYGDSMQWRAVYERGWFFKTEEECQEFCNRLNDAINQVKP